MAIADQMEEVLLLRSDKKDKKADKECTIELLQMVGIRIFHHQAHTLLALVAYDFFVREGLVADGQLGYVYGATHLLYQL